MHFLTLETTPLQTIFLSREKGGTNIGKRAYPDDPEKNVSVWKYYIETVHPLSTLAAMGDFSQVKGSTEFRIEL